MHFVYEKAKPGVGVNKKRNYDNILSELVRIRAKLAKEFT